MLEVRNLTKVFNNGLLSKENFLAVNDVSLSLSKGKTLGVAGNSGCGKSTLARLIGGLDTITSGSIFFEGTDVTTLKGKSLRSLRLKMQILFQHPESALNPSMRLEQSLMEPMKIHKLYTAKAQQEKLYEVLNLVQLDPNLLRRYPHQISGGEAQRVCIGRLLTMMPNLLILDEPTSMLDVSVQAEILNLLKILQEKLGLTYLMISHDLEVLLWMCDKIAIMKDGIILEQGDAHTIFKNPTHPFTKELVENFTLFPKQ